MMEQTCVDTLESLNRRFEVSYDDYIVKINSSNVEEAIELASEIVAVKEVYVEMCFWLGLTIVSTCWPFAGYSRPMSEPEAAYLMSLENPLLELASKRWLHTFSNRMDFQGFFESEISAEIAKR